MEIKLLVARLGITLEVVHKPGEMMILQGSAGISQGLRMPVAQAQQCPSMKDIFAPVPPDPSLLYYCLQKCSDIIHSALLPLEQWHIVHDKLPWHKESILHHNTMWLPLP
eukprot:2826729-Ditylum_brightwellii.AAC.1